MTSVPDKSELEGYIFDIQGLSVHDGPGCRTAVFLGGCTLNCFWCSNPEGLSKGPVPVHFVSKCISCFNCVDECKHKAIHIDEGRIVITRELCYDCESRTCASVCHSDALKLSGYKISTSKLLSIIRRDRQFWGNEGGITLTGGEPLLQIDFARETLKQCHQAYIHTAIETCGNVPRQSFTQVLPYLDWIFFDLKHFDSASHFSGTGAGNKLILGNAKYVADEFDGRLIFRLPLIPRYNDSVENIKSYISFLKEVGRSEINILPLHHLGRDKYPILDKEYTGLDYPIPAYADLLNIKEQFTNENITCYIGSETPF